MALDGWSFSGGIFFLGVVPLIVWHLNRRRKWLGWLFLVGLVAGVAALNIALIGRVIP